MCVWNLHVPDVRFTAREANYLQELPFLCNHIWRALPPWVWLTHLCLIIWVNVFVKEIFNLYRIVGNSIPIKVFMVLSPCGFKCISKAPLILNKSMWFILVSQKWLCSVSFFIYIYATDQGAKSKIIQLNYCVFDSMKNTFHNFVCVFVLVYLRL